MPAAIALGSAAIALALAIDGGIAGPAAVPEVLRTVVPFVGLAVACGYAPARLLLPRAMLPHLGLFVMPFGVACSAFALTFLGFARMPFNVSLPVVAAAGVASAVVLRVRWGPSDPRPGDAQRAGGVWMRLALPLWIAALIVAVALIPTFRSGIATVTGQNGDAVQAVGVTQVLRHSAPPDKVHAELPLDHVPAVWRSKYPIYYVATAANALSGLHAAQTFSIVCAAIYGLLALACYHFAFYVLGAGPLASLAAMTVVPLSRWVIYLGIHPFYNQLWGLFLGFMIYVFGLRFLREPSRRTAVATALFFGLGAFAYPLMLPFPVIVLGLSALAIRRQRRRAGEDTPWLAALRLRRPRRALVWAPIAVLSLPFLFVLVAGVIQKLIDFLKVAAPGKDLSAWRGGDPYLAFPTFFGIPGTTVLSVAGALAVIAAAVIRLRRSPPETGSPLLAACALGLAGAGYFRLRHDGELLYFRSLSFSAPFLLAAATVGVAEAVRQPARRYAAAGAVAALTVCGVLMSRAEIANTYPQLNPEMLQLGAFARRIPPDRSIRIDLPPDAYQAWARQVLYQHPLSASRPPQGPLSIFPHPPAGRKADYLVSPAAIRPADADGRPLFRNKLYALYLMKPGVPGPDRSSRRLAEPNSNAPAE